MQRAGVWVALALAFGGCGGNAPTGPGDVDDLAPLAAGDLASSDDDMAPGSAQCLDCCRCPGAPGTCDHGVCLVKKETATTPVPPPDSCGNICGGFGYACSTQCTWQRLNPSTGTIETIVEAGVAAYANPRDFNTKTQYLDTCAEVPPARSVVGDAYAASTCCCTPR